MGAVLETTHPAKGHMRVTPMYPSTPSNGRVTGRLNTAPSAELLLERLRTSPCCYKFAVLEEGESELPPVDTRLACLHDAKVLLLESIFLWEYYDLSEDSYDDLDETVRIANMCGAGLMDMFHKKQTLEDGKVWDDSDACMDIFEDTNMETHATAMLCEASIMGVVLPADVAAFMTSFSMVHRDDCAEQLHDGDPCFTDEDLGVDDVCRLAELLRGWDISRAEIAETNLPLRLAVRVHCGHQFRRVTLGVLIHCRGIPEYSQRTLGVLTHSTGIPPRDNTQHRNALPSAEHAYPPSLAARARVCGGMTECVVAGARAARDCAARAEPAAAADGRRRCAAR